MERMVLDMDLVRRDEFDAVKDLAAAARAEADSLKARLDALEASMQTPAKAPSKAATPKKSAKSS
jgi:BMFP domain-containing protein YqiC